MNYQDRLKEVEQLEKDNREILATPLMSEGNISPMQVGLFSPRQKAKWQSNAMAKMNLLSRIKELKRTDLEIMECDNKKKEQIKQERITQLKNQIDTINNLGVMSHSKNGKLKPKYQRTIEECENEIHSMS